MANRPRASGRIGQALRLMLLFIGDLALAGVVWPAIAATTYTYTAAPNYDSFGLFTAPCTTGTCANYTSGMHLTGSFTTATPLAANLVNANIAAQVTSYSFSDGINTYTSPNGRIIAFDIYTDGAGVPTSSTFIDIQVWTTGSAPHTAGDRYSEFSIDFNVDASNNIACSSVGTSGGTSDACIGGGGDSNTSTASNSGAGTWAVAGAPPPGQSAVAPVPTLSTWALGMLATLVMALGWLQWRGNRRT